MFGGMLSFVGVILLTPVLVPAAIRLIGPVVRHAGPAARLAHFNSLRNPRRTAATSTALLIGVTLISAVVIGSSSIAHKVNTSLDTNAPVDLAVTSTAADVPNNLIGDIEAVSGVADTASLPGVSARIDDQDTEVIGVDRPALALTHGDDSLTRLAADQIVLPYQWQINGETVVIKIGDQRRELQVVFGDGLGDAPIVRTSTLEAMGASLTGTRAVWVRAAENADAGRVTSDVTAIAGAAKLDVVGGLSERAEIIHILDVVLAVTVGMLAIAVLIALIGVGNTLSLSVLERVRENSLLRALGLGRRELRTMLAVEALLIAVVAAVLGIALGMIYAWFGVKTTTNGVFASSPSLQIPWGQLALILFIAILAGLTASVLPARRAAEIQPAAGLQAV
jgi:putative ABC transport system permease protein